MEIFELKLAKVDIYLQKRDFTSILRMVDRYTKFLETKISEGAHVREAIQKLKETKYQTLFTRGNAVDVQEAVDMVQTMI